MRFTIGVRFLYQSAKEEFFLIGDVYDISIDGKHIFFKPIHFAGRKNIGSRFTFDSPMYRESILLSPDMELDENGLAHLAGTLYGT